MTSHSPLPSPATTTTLPLVQRFAVIRAAAGWIAIRDDPSGHVFTCFFNPAHTAVAEVRSLASDSAWPVADDMEIEAKRFAETYARDHGLIFTAGQARVPAHPN